MDATAAAEQAGAQRQTLENTFIVDCDVHVNENPLVLAAYCEEPWRQSLEELRHSQATWRYLDIPGFSIGWSTLDPLIPGASVEGEAAGLHPDAETRTVPSGAQLQEDLRGLHVDAAILFPDHLLALAAIPNPLYASALARAYNRWLTEVVLPGGPALYGAVIAVPHDPAEGARQIRAYADDPRIRAVYLPTAAVNPLWGDRKYDPIFEAAQETGLPVCLHSVGIIHPNYPHGAGGIETQACRHAILHTFGIMANLVSLISTGVPVRFPELKVVFTEAGISWVPFLAWRLDKEYSERRSELPFYDERPSHYVKRFFFSTQPIEEPEDPRALVSLLESFGGVDPFMFASDWPHHDFDHPRQVFRLPFDEESRAKIMGKTARRVFRLDADA